MKSYPSVSLLITHYNRSKSLEALLRSFMDLQCEFGAIVVSDDGSRSEHLDYIKALKSQLNFELIITPINKGLGNNINKGQDAISTPYTLYVQEDFVPTQYFPEALSDGLSFMNDDKELDLVRFYSYLQYPYTKLSEKGFSQMYFNPLGFKYGKLFYYSDHPHLRRSTFFEKFGRYREGLKVERTEYKMCVAFIQNKGKGLFYQDYQKLFNQRNSIEEPSTVNRSAWRRGNNFFVSKIRNVYRQVKYNYDILLSPQEKIKS